MKSSVESTTNTSYEQGFFQTSRAMSPPLHHKNDWAITGARMIFRFISARQTRRFRQNGSRQTRISPKSAIAPMRLSLTLTMLMSMLTDREAAAGWMMSKTKAPSFFSQKITLPEMPCATELQRSAGIAAILMNTADKTELWKTMMPKSVITTTKTTMPSLTAASCF